MNDVIDSGRRRFVLATTALASGMLESAPISARAAEPAPDAEPAVRRGSRPDLTVRIVDILHGNAAVGLRIDLACIDGDRDLPLCVATIDAQGGTGDALLAGDAYRAGTYTLRLHVGEYFRARDVPSPFLTVVPIRFRIARADERLHLPVQFGPWSYTAYRGT